MDIKKPVEQTIKNPQAFTLRGLIYYLKFKLQINQNKENKHPSD
jgi:hypothetical protein